MLKAIKAIQRSYLRAPYKAFMVSQKQHDGAALTSKLVPNRATAMQHTIKKPGGKA